MSNHHTTEELDKLVSSEVAHIQDFGFSNLDKAEFYVVPSDDTPEQIKEEYF